MKYFILILFSLVANVAISQETKIFIPQDQENDWHIGINFSPDYCYVSNQSKAFASKIGYTVGLNLKYELNQNYALEFGTQFSNKGYTLDFSKLTFGDRIFTVGGFTYATSDPIRGGIKNHNYLDINTRFLYQKGQSKTKFISSIGLAANIRLNSPGYGSLRDEHGTTIDLELYPLNVTVSLSAGLAHQFGKRLHFTLEPTIRRGLLKTENLFYATKLKSIGLNIGFYYTLK